MTAIPFLILGLGGFYVLLLVAARDNAVKRSPLRRVALRMAALSAGLSAGLKAAAVAAADFQKHAHQLSVALGVSMVEACDRMSAAMRSMEAASAAEAARRERLKQV